MSRPRSTGQGHPSLLVNTGMGGPVPTHVAFVLAIRRNQLRMVMKQRSRPGTEIPQDREPICARIKATNSLARV